MPHRTLAFLLSTCLLCSAVVAEDAPPDWMSYGAWQPVEISTSYYSLEVLENGQVGLWFNAHFQGHDAVIHLSGPDPSDLERVLPRFNAEIIHDYDQELGGRDSPIMSRSSATRLNDGSVLVLASIGPAYDGGRSELFPALFYSANGVDGWRHLGPPAGEAEVWLAEQRRAGKRIRCEGGGIVQLPDGRLRMYNQNLGAPLAVLEADRPEGPWTFVRDEQGEVHNALQGLGGGWLFPQVSAIGEHGYLLTGGNTWPPTAIVAAVSADGLRFVPPQGAEEPAVIFRPGWLAPDARQAKTLRVAWDEDRQRLLAMSNPLAAGRWSLFWTWAHLDLTVFTANGDPGE
ncbi:MAG: hypothetical protein EA401_00835 [Planctomycetota bacterium]|nr:MAG: hypothetical protein EA401_00835 [Planctomycetota bacterium]